MNRNAVAGASSISGCRCGREERIPRGRGVLAGRDVFFICWLGIMEAFFEHTFSYYP